MPGWGDDKIGPKVRPADETYENVADPAKGEPVPRCYECGRPEGSRLRLVDFAVSLGGVTLGVMRWCEADYRRHNPRDPREADPLQVGEGAISG